ncbi:MAG: glycosyltransferase family 4 protein [Ruminococcus sp.]|nr:glycosyltransferase family 4 protein [Ruminococcus sp.]
MGAVLFISNITYKITSFSSSSIYATHKMGMRFIHAANWSETPVEQIKLFEKENDIEICNVPISRSPFSLSNINAFKQLCRIVKDNNVEYIHCNTPVGGLLGRLVGKKCGVKKVIYQAHGFHFYKGAPIINWVVYYSIERIFARFTDAIVTMNGEDYANAQKFHLRNRGKVYNVHGVGINLSEYDGIQQYRERKRLELGLRDDDIVLISMGDLIPRKNYKIAIEAISKCKNPNVHYLICGKGEELDNLKQLAKDLGVQEQVYFLGYRTDIKELLAAADIFLFTTLQEGMPRSMMEAMAAGLPCIASKIRGNVDLIENGKGGFLCMPTDSDAFAQAIRLCTYDVRKKFGRENLIAIQQYDIHVVEEEIRKIYEEVFQ